jgi:putative peptidoglycan binding protein
MKKFTLLSLVGTTSIAMVALTTADAQNTSPSGSVPPQRKQNPVRVQTSPNATAIPAGSWTKDAQGRWHNGSVPPEQKQNPGRVHTSPNPAATPGGTPTKNVTGKKGTNDGHDNYAEALRRYRHEHHDRTWWKQHYIVIVLVGGGYYYRDSGYWYPAWGYDPNYQTYDYDGPIYTYGNLLPDQVVINVQHALKELGYYADDVTGSLSAATRSALSAFQQDYNLDITGTVDEPTVRALGLI